MVNGVRLKPAPSGSRVGAVNVLHQQVHTPSVAAGAEFRHTVELLHQPDSPPWVLVAALNTSVGTSVVEVVSSFAVRRGFCYHIFWFISMFVNFVVCLFCIAAT